MFYLVIAMFPNGSVIRFHTTCRVLAWRKTAEYRSADAWVSNQGFIR